MPRIHINKLLWCAEQLWLDALPEACGSVVVRALHLQSTGLRFDSRLLHCRVATLDRSFTRAQFICSYDRMVL